MVILPENVYYIPGSSSIGSEQIEEPENNENILVYRLGDLSSNWTKSLKLQARLKDKADGELITKAMFITDTEMKKGVRSLPVINKLKVERKKLEIKNMVFQAHFKRMGTELTERSKRAIREIIKRFEGA